ncbi:MAG: formate transporter FocA [Rhizobiales bacterium NRL2]|jgi:formate/nitrite transporter|nr:MAG: formate transporter FocA [Rhizobiales bacterium NRL2]
MPNGTGNPMDAYTPAEMAVRVRTVGVAKARLPAVSVLTLGVLAGAFIAFGAVLYTIVMTGSPLGFGPARLLGGAAFSLGLILVVVGGAELFTGNSLMVMAWAARQVSTARLLRNWALVYPANLAGALGTLGLVWLAGTHDMAGGAVGDTAAAIAAAKLSLSPLEAFARGVLCNVLVCLAVWLCFAARDVAGKVLVIVPPITAFVALGFEHSVANMYLIPAGMLAGGEFDLAGLLGNLVPVTLGNIAGGGLLVAGVYWICYLRGRTDETD